MKAAGATKVRKPSAWPRGTPMRILNGSPTWRRMRVSEAVAIATIPMIMRTMWISKIRWRGSRAYSAVIPARPGPRPKPRRKNTPARAAARAFLSRLA